MPIIHWFRRDLRLHDNTALFNACRDAADGILPVFIFDDAILKHPDCGGPLVQFMLGCLENLRSQLGKAHGDLLLLHDNPADALAKLARKTKASAVYTNADYDPAAIARDDAVAARLKSIGVNLRLFKDQVIFQHRQIVSASSGAPYTVYTPYKNAWLARFHEEFGELGPEPLDRPTLKFAPMPASGDLPTMQALGFEPIGGMEIPAGPTYAKRMLDHFCTGPLAKYHETRNIPAFEDGTSRLSPHLRMGTVSPRTVLRAALSAKKAGGTTWTRGTDTWIGQIIWREFYQQILFNFPHVATSAFRRPMDHLPWRTDAGDLQRWQTGRTGFPIVDAAMRQLNTTGWMHNRLRMIVAMFLTKDLLIDYKLGERYFANHLIDVETAQNNGGWQWSASTGTDAQPYFRIFNPVQQSQACDPAGTFIRRYCPELKNVPGKYLHAPHEMPPEIQQQVGVSIGKTYPKPMVNHAALRQRTLDFFRQRVS